MPHPVQKHLYLLSEQTTKVHISTFSLVPLLLEHYWCISGGFTKYPHDYGAPAWFLQHKITIYMLILELVFASDRMFLKRLKMGMSSSLTGCHGWSVVSCICSALMCTSPLASGFSHCYLLQNISKVWNLPVKRGELKTETRFSYRAKRQQHVKTPSGPFSPGGLEFWGTPEPSSLM